MSIVQQTCAKECSDVSMVPNPTHLVANCARAREEVNNNVGKNDAVFAALIIGSVGGGALVYWKGHDDGYQKAKSEDAAYIRRLEDDNGQLQNSNSMLQAELLQERRSKAQLREELDKLKTELAQPTIQK